MNLELYNYKMLIAYDGTHYSGWQFQLNGIGIQAILEEKITLLLSEKVRVVGSGRTDAGVHARGQIANFLCHTQLDMPKFLHSINAMIPFDIRVKSIEVVPEKFHARYHAKGKVYHYHICTDKINNPFQKLYSVHVKYEMNISLLKEAAALFVGKHDFTSFANEAHKGSAAKDPVRTLKRLDVIEVEGGLRLEFEADGFLYKMVRNIVGTMLEVARGKRDISEINPMLEAKDRSKSGRAAPAHGLFLMEVHY